MNKKGRLCSGWFGTVMMVSKHGENAHGLRRIYLSRMTGSWAGLWQTTRASFEFVAVALAIA